MPNKMTFWLSYDFGLKGDFPGIYKWLDNHNAVECGDCLAAVPDYAYQGDFIESLKKDLSENVELEAGKRIYVMWMSSENMPIGKFIFGKRKQPVWAGCGDLKDETEQNY